MLHKTSQERYGKLKKVFARLMRWFNRDDLDDFVQTANSLREWIRQDETLIPEQRDALERFVVDQSLDWQICNQLANHQKHRGARPRSKKTRLTADWVPRVTAVGIVDGAQGVSVPPSMRIVGAGEEVWIECGGRRESGLAFVVRVFRHFHYIFEVAPIPIGERVVRYLGELLLEWKAQGESDQNR